MILFVKTFELSTVPTVSTADKMSKITCILYNDITRIINNNNISFILLLDYKILSCVYYIYIVIISVNIYSYYYT